MNKSEAFIIATYKYAKKQQKFPKKILIAFKGKRLATVTIDVTPMSRYLWGSQYKDRYFNVIKELVDTDLIKRHLECAMEIKYSGLSFSFFMCFIFAIEDSRLLNYSACTDEDILETIRTHGPISFCVSSVQERLNDWLADHTTASVKLSKLKEALLQYTYGEGYKERLFRQGSPGIGVFAKYGTEWFKRAYLALVGVLKKVKREMKSSGEANIELTIDLAYRAYLGEQMQKTSGAQADLEKGRMTPLEFAIFYYDLLGPSHNPILLGINRDELLKKEFIQGRWEPNKLAKEILSEILGVSVQKIESVLYREHK